MSKEPKIFFFICHFTADRQTYQVVRCSNEHMFGQWDPPLLFLFMNIESNLLFEKKIILAIQP